MTQSANPDYAHLVSRLNAKLNKRVEYSYSAAKKRARALKVDPLGQRQHTGGSGANLVGKSAVTVHDAGRCHAFVGRRLEVGDYDRMGTVPAELQGSPSP